MTRRTSDEVRHIYTFVRDVPVYIFQTLISPLSATSLMVLTRIDREKTQNSSRNKKQTSSFRYYYFYDYCYTRWRRLKAENNNNNNNETWYIILDECGKGQMVG